MTRRFVVISLFPELVEAFARTGIVGRAVAAGLVDIQDRLVQSRAAIALAVIKTYKAVGGGWEIRCEQPIELQPAPLVTELDQPAENPIPKIARRENENSIQSFRSGFQKRARRLEIHGTEIIETTSHQ